MGTQRWTCLLGVFLCLAAGMESTIAAVDPDAGDEAGVASARTVAAVTDPDCNLIGGIDQCISGQCFSGGSRYRGDVYRIDVPARLKQIKMQLAFSGNTELTVAIHQQEPDGTYKRIRCVSILGAVGTGALEWYSTAGLLDPPVLLEPGFNYAIGFAWGSRTVTYTLDAQPYPVPFEVGEVLGGVAAGPLPPDDLCPGTFSEFQIYTAGAYTMQVCFEPVVGVCCCNGQCAEVLETQCVGAGCFFHGERTRCSETPCIFGACCKPCGTCDNDYAPEACVAAGGVAHWSGVSCPVLLADLCPPVTGACCRTNGSCVEVCEQLCDGVYQGDRTTCTPNPCKGACCIAGSDCRDRTPANCAAFAGQFRGLGTTCATLSGTAECGGACCFGDLGLSTCRTVAQRSACSYDSFNFTAYRGDGSICPNCGVIDDYRACCLPDGTCINTSVNATGQQTCTAVGVNGELNADPSLLCEELSAGCSVKACCLPEGDCAVLTNTACTNLGGSRPAGGPGTCGVSTCTTGACCFTDDGLCTQRTAAACTAKGGNYHGNGTNCNTPALVCPGIGACCRYDGDCFDNFTPGECTTIGGTYEGNATVCDAPSVGCDQRGACCAITGLCQLLTESQCNGPNGIGGEFKGVRVPCPPGNMCTAGACCLPEGCEIRTEVGCTPSGGDYQGDNTECFHDLLPLDPPNCAIDAREPHDPLDAQTVYGWDAVLFALACEFAAPDPGHFQVSVTPVSNETPIIVGIVPGYYSALVTLNRAVAPQEWICLTHLGSGIETCFSLLPGDVNGDRTSNAVDVESLRSKLTGPAIPPPWQCDLDRSGSCTPADILTEVDLLNGADEFDPWLDQAIVTCPTAPTP